MHKACWLFHDFIIYVTKKKQITRKDSKVEKVMQFAKTVILRADNNLVQAELFISPVLADESLYDHWVSLSRHKAAGAAETLTIGHKAWGQVEKNG